MYRTHLWYDYRNWLDLCDYVSRLALVVRGYTGTEQDQQQILSLVMAIAGFIPNPEPDTLLPLRHFGYSLVNGFSEKAKRLAWEIEDQEIRRMLERPGLFGKNTRTRK